MLRYLLLCSCCYFYSCWTDVADVVVAAVAWLAANIVSNRWSAAGWRASRCQVLGLTCDYTDREAKDPLLCCCCYSWRCFWCVVLKCCCCSSICSRHFIEQLEFRFELEKELAAARGKYGLGIKMTRRRFSIIEKWQRGVWWRWEGEKKTLLLLVRFYLKGWSHGCWKGSADLKGWWSNGWWLLQMGLLSGMKVIAGGLTEISWMEDGEMGSLERGMGWETWRGEEVWWGLWRM